MGAALTASVLRSTCCSVVSVSMSGPAPFTTISAVVLPIWSVALISRVSIWRTMPSRRNSLKPCFENVIAYLPGARNGTSYNPDWFVVVGVTTPVCTFLMKTDTPSTTAPEGSVTEPSSSALWPKELAESPPTASTGSHTYEEHATSSLVPPHSQISLCHPQPGE